MECERFTDKVLKVEKEKENEKSLEQILAEASARLGGGGAQAQGQAQGQGTVRTWPTSSAATATSAVKPAIQKVAYNHQAMIDMILANPAISQNALANHFGLTPSWVSQVMVSDAFQEALAKRREEIIDPALKLTVEQNFKALVARSLDILQQKLNKPAEEIPDQLALRALEVGSRAAGYGVRDAVQPPTKPIDVHIHLEQMGHGLVKLLERKKLEAGQTEFIPAETALIMDLTADSSLPTN